MAIAARHQQRVSLCGELNEQTPCFLPIKIDQIVSAREFVSFCVHSRNRCQGRRFFLQPNEPSAPLFSYHTHESSDTAMLPHSVRLPANLPTWCRSYGSVVVAGSGSHYLLLAPSDPGSNAGAT